LKKYQEKLEKQNDKTKISKFLKEKFNYKKSKKTSSDIVNDILNQHLSETKKIDLNND